MSDPVYRRSPGALSREVDGEVLIVPELREVLDLDDVFYRLGDPVSVRVWELLEEQRALTSLIDSITHEFDVDPKTARVDLERFLAELVASGAATRGP